MLLNCFFCKEPADRIVYYSKYYQESARDTIETPTLCCAKCWFNGTAKKELFVFRGGMECIAKWIFKDISGWSKKNVGRHLSKRSYEINQMANKSWRKTLWYIYYSNQEPKKGRIDETPAISN